MAMQSVLVTITLLMICSLSGCSGDRGTEGQPPTTKPGGSTVKAGAKPAGKAKKLALLVGINNYKAVNGLSGCVADVRNMEGLLRGTFEFPDDSIRILTDEQATHVAIVQAFKDHLIGRADEEAVVIFHYSGHGSRMKDPSGKSPSGEISTIVPHDSRTDGVYDISADELRGLFSLLSEKTKNVTFIFDSCHSGLELRDIATARARVADPDPRDPPPPPPEALLAPRGVGEADEGLKSRDYALLSACQADEVAFEYADKERNPCGTLTHFLVAEVLGSGKAGATYRDVMDKVKAKVTGAYRRQHPQLEGAKMDDFLFSDRGSLPQPFVLASPEGDGIALEAGQVHGMTEGSVFDVYPPGTKAFDDPAKAIARAELTAVDAYRSTAKLIGGHPIEPSSRAVERRHNFGDRKVRLHIAKPDQSPVLQRVREAVAGAGRTDPDNPKSPTFAQAFEATAQPADAQLLLKETKTKQGARSIALLGGDATELSPPASVDEAGAVELILERLARWSGRHNLGDKRIRLHVADAGKSGVLGKVREAAAGSGRTDPDNPKSPSFAQAFELVDKPADAQLLLKETKTKQGARIPVLSEEKGKDESELLLRAPADEAGAVELALERLTAWAKWLNLLRLDNPRRGLDIDFEIRSATRDSLDPELAKKPDLTLTAGKDVEFVVTNRSGKDIYFAILDLASDGSVGVVYPGEGRNEALAPDKSYRDTAPTSVPEGRKVSRDNLKLVATQAPVDFRFLRQEAIRDVPRDGEDPLAGLLGQATLIERNVGGSRAKLDGWATKVRILEVVEKP